MVATRSARFSRCVLRCQGSRSPSTALMLRAACSIPPIQTPNPSKNGPSSSRYPTVNHFRPKPIGGEGLCLIPEDDLPYFKDTLEWVVSPDHGNPLLSGHTVMMELLPGPAQSSGTGVLLLRRRDDY